ncbi:hypothetical protein [Streptomyces lydicus]|uniref:hypothetical protein n=1 Tax=Streptomyces lydicus TaxID=47763 RepID=UPI001011B649|nr:hypothetical protein [Streptomyces lydicus]MCZ1012293.1 hypothetical protein [Streptomyces lydicus]
MAADVSTPQPSNGNADQPENTVQTAIDWLTGDRTRTRQRIERQGTLVAPGQLLEWARFEVQFDSLLPEQPTNRCQALINAQAEWLIRHLPPDDAPPSVDSAQQAGRAWGILISADTQVLPDQGTLTEVCRRTNISLRAADEIRAQARTVSAAYNRADLLHLYDRAPDTVLIDDWNTLAACGPELPEAAAWAQDVLELLTARIADLDDYSWMDTAAQCAAQVYDSVMLAQDLLEPVAALIPARDQPHTAADETRLVAFIEEGGLSAAATAAARARAVQKWAEQDTPAASAEPDRARMVEAAAPATRTLVRLNEALAVLGPALEYAPTLSLDPEHVAQIVEPLGRLVTQVRDISRTGSPLPREPIDRRAPQHHQHPPSPGHNPGGGPPRIAP